VETGCERLTTFDARRDNEPGVRPPDDPDLARLIEAWPTLPVEIKATIRTILAAANASRIAPSVEQPSSARRTVKSKRRHGGGVK